MALYGRIPISKPYERQIFWLDKIGHGSLVKVLVPPIVKNEQNFPNKVWGGWIPNQWGVQKGISPNFVSCWSWTSLALALHCFAAILLPNVSILYFLQWTPLRSLTFGGMIMVKQTVSRPDQRENEECDVLHFYREIPQTAFFMATLLPF